MTQPDRKGPGPILAAMALLASTLGSPLPAMGALSTDDVESLRREFRSEIKSVRQENAGLKKRLEVYENARIDESKRLDDIQLQVAQSDGLNAGYDKNFYIKSSDNNFRLNLSGLIQFQGNFYEGNDIPDRAMPVFNAGLGTINRADTFFLRRARFKASGNVVSPDITFALEAELAGTSATLRDGYINYHARDYAEIRVGQFKPPFSLENLESDADIETIERAAIVALLGLDRRVGAQLSGKLFDGRLEYAGMVLNNLGFGNQGQNASDTNGDKAVAGRVVVNPFATSDNKWTKDLSLFAAAATGNNGPTSASSGLTVTDIVAGVPSAPVVFGNTVPYIGGNQTQFDVGMSWIIDRFRLKGEYIWAHLNRRDVPVTGTYPYGALGLHPIQIGGGYVQLSYVVLDRPHATIVPVIKYETMHVRGDNIVSSFILDSGPPVVMGRFVNPAEYDNNFQALTLGFSWFVNPKLKFMANYINERLGEDVIGSTLLRQGVDTNQNIFLFRTQLKF